MWKIQNQSPRKNFSRQGIKFSKILILIIVINMKMRIMPKNMSRYSDFSSFQQNFTTYGP